MEFSDEVKREFKAVILAARRVSADVGREVEEVLRDGKERPLSREEASQLLNRVITVLRQGAKKRGDKATSDALEGDINTLVEQVISTKDRLAAGSRPLTASGNQVSLVSRNGIGPAPVQPRPCFHGREVPMNSGFVKATDIKLWENNARLDIHLGQFSHKNGRMPTSEELLDIMLSKMEIQGVTDGDQFEIAQLARSIAINGVRKPPILDTDGTLLDGNRRIAACYYILNNSEFSSEDKRRVEYVFVWQLTEHATTDERNAVVVSLNFEPDCKQDWPEYVKARKVYEEWQAVLALEPRLPGPQRQADLKRDLSKKFALGPDTTVVNRYLKMVDWANDFEEYQTNKKGKDKYEVKHRADRYFQYFDEMAKGTKAGGVAYSLNQDEGFKHLVFDLLFDGKFKNWRQIRELKLIYDNEEARDALTRAREEKDEEVAEEHLENAMAIARSRHAEAREVGANTRIESFVKWLEELPVRAFRDLIKTENLRRLLKALKLVEQQAKTILGSHG
jgi:hypothetical protein